MEDQNTQSGTPTHPIVDIMPSEATVAAMTQSTMNTPISQKTSYHNKRKVVLISVVILLIIILVGVAYLLFHHKRPVPLNAAATLQALKAVSKPVTTTTPERATTVSNLSQHSSTTITNKQGQLNMLNMLSK